MHFCPVHPAAIPGLTVGCLLFNLFQRGRAAAGLARRHRRNAAGHNVHVSAAPRRALKLPLPALLMPAVWNAVLVGWELTYYIGEIPFWLNAVYVAAGEAAVLLVLGTALYFALGSRRLQERLFPQGV